MTIASITARVFKAGNRAEPDYYLATFSGFCRVGTFRSNWWAVCPDENAGFGISFCCGPETRVYSEAALVDTFGSLVAASLAIEIAGGHVATAVSSMGSHRPNDDRRCWRDRQLKKGSGR